MTFQDIKDTFYATLRDRIALLNPARTMVVRGQVRPAVLVAENEMPNTNLGDLNCYVLRWSEPKQQNNLLSIACELAYATAGTQAAAGMDRGRLLAAMDTELLVALSVPEQHAAGFSVSEASAGAAVSLPANSNIFWSDLNLDSNLDIAADDAAQLARKAQVEVFGYA